MMSQGAELLAAHRLDVTLRNTFISEKGGSMKPIIRGLKLQMVYRLVAEAEFTDSAIARYLKVPLSALQEVKARPQFAARVEEERSAIAREKSIRARLSIGVPSVSESCILFRPD